MVKISILYPYQPQQRFDTDYYLTTHMPMAIERLSVHPGYRGVSVERGLSGGAPETPPAYTIMCHYLFDSVEDFRAAFGAHAGVLQEDIPNYTDMKATIQISEVVMTR